MPRVIVMCGPSGSGKSTYARQLERDGMVRLSFDVEMWRRGISEVPQPADVRAGIEADLRARLLAPAGMVPETVYLATDRDTVLRRMRERRGKHSDDFVVPESLVAQYFDHFQPPTPDEGPLRVIPPDD
jgi:predicted kinase